MQSSSQHPPGETQAPTPNGTAGRSPVNWKAGAGENLGDRVSLLPLAPNGGKWCWRTPHTGEEQAAARPAFVRSG